VPDIDAAHDQPASAAPTTYRRIDVEAAEVAYVRGTEIDGELIFPTLDELAATFGSARRSIASHSKRRGWPEKRRAYQRAHALEAHRRKIKRLLHESDKADDRFRTIGLAIAQLVAQRITLAHQKGSNARDLDALATAGLKAQRMVKIALGLPVDLMEALEIEGTKTTAAGGEELQKFIDKLNALEGEDFPRAVDSILGPTPAGSGKVMDIKALKEKTG
jgi:hypothetical protein